MSTRQNRKSKYKGKRPYNPRDPRYSPKGTRTSQRQQKRRPKRTRRSTFRRGGAWVAIRGVSSLTGEVIKLFLLPVIIPLRAFRKRQNKGKK